MAGGLIDGQISYALPAEDSKIMPISGNNCNQMHGEVFQILCVVTWGFTFLLALGCFQNLWMFDLLITDDQGVEHWPEQLRAGFLPEQSLWVARCGYLRI